ncbi:putative conserved protein, contains GH25 family domain [Mucilaginibacter xinganensis]|uniref:Putative conserved protein, contains GH25 family domain n=2 Tax=Mucilaginibacter xinganensis TaxID=1234841 RepID=A0A223NS47_9SPHI|nr:putative conserved protein, contains GH25 family domain [Mucilaginibacter xinganensis]
MKRKPLLLIILAAAIGLATTTHDFFLLPELFFMHKGDKLNLHLLSGEAFTKEAEIGYQPAKTTRFMLHNGSKKIDLTRAAKDSAAPVLNYEILNSGQSLIEMTRGYEFSFTSRDAYAEFLNSQGLDKMAEKVKSGNQFRVREKYTRYLKTLVSVDNHDGNAYGKVLNEDYEIILKENPYNKKYGDDMVGLLKFKGKPAPAAAVTLYVKTTTGNVYTQNLTTSTDGEVTFNLSREGVYLLRSVRIEQTKDKDADYESWWTSYTFPFSSSEDLPNTYKEFGFGNKH